MGLYRPTTFLQIPAKQTREPPEGEMALFFRPRIRNLRPGGLRSSMVLSFRSPMLPTIGPTESTERG